MPWKKSPRKRLSRTSDKLLISPKKLEWRRRRKQKTDIEHSGGKSALLSTKIVTPCINNHDYLCTEIEAHASENMLTVESLLPGVTQMIVDYELLKDENESLKRSAITVEALRDDDKKLKFWTGFPNYAMFLAVFEFVKPKAIHLKYWHGTKTDRSQNFQTRNTLIPGPVRKLTLIDEYLMTLIRLRTNTMLVALANMFSVSESTVNSIFTTWVNFLAAELKMYFQLPDPDILFANKSQSFRNFPRVCMVIDCTEVFTESPSDLVEKKQMFSNYKNHQTFKFLVAISTHPAVVFVSRMYGGKASDMLITTEATNMLTSVKLSHGQIMADRGFTSSYKGTPVDVELITPAFKTRGRSQMTETEINESESCSEARIHIERVIQRIKSYHILDGKLKLCMRHVAEQIFVVCAFLSNFQSPVVNE